MTSPGWTASSSSCSSPALEHTLRSRKEKVLVCEASCFATVVLFTFWSYSGLDVSEALKLPGVVDVITAKDIPGKKAHSMFGYEEELLAMKEVLT